MASSVETVGGGPALYSFSAVGPDEPDAVAIAFFPGELLGEFEQDGSGRAAIVGAYESRVAQGINRIVVAEDDDDAIFCAGKFSDDVADGELPFHGVGDDGVVFYVVGFEVVFFEVIDDVAL